MSRHILTSLWLVPMLFSLLAANPDPIEAGSRFLAKVPGHIVATLDFEADPLVTMQEIPFELVIRDPQGNTLQGLAITSDMTMPAMPMPPNKPRVLPQGDRYRGTVIFTMAGAWQATFTVTPQEGKTYPLAFDIPSVLLK